MSIIDTVNAAPLDPDLMKRMMMCVAEMPEEQRGDITGRAVGLIYYERDRS